MPETFTFEQGRRYRIVFLPPGARIRTETYEGNYLGVNYYGSHEFDLRPAAGTSSITNDMIRSAEDIGPAVYARS